MDTTTTIQNAMMKKSWRIRLDDRRPGMAHDAARCGSLQLDFAVEFDVELEAGDLEGDLRRERFRA